MDRNYKLLSVDVWDTLLRRSCHPDEVKLSTSRYVFLKFNQILKKEFNNPFAILQARIQSELEIAGKNRALGRDGEYTLEEVLETTLEKISDLNDPLQMAEIIKEILEAEIRQECSVTRPDTEITAALSRISADNRIFISDFYMSSRHIGTIMDNTAHALAGAFSGGYSSSDYLLNKVSGRLYKRVHDDLGVSPNEHIHIGDSTIADMSAARALGITAIRYNSPKEKKIIHQAKRIYEKRIRHSNIDLLIKTIMRELEKVEVPASLAQREQTLFRTGIRYSLMFYSFILFVIEEAIMNNFDKIYYLTREGYFFKEIHDAISRNNPLGFPIPEGDLLHVSRLSTYGASIRSFCKGELMRIWSLYNRQSLSQLFLTLNVDITRYTSFIEKHSLDIHEIIQNPWEDPGFNALFNDPAFTEQINREIAEKKNRLRRYLSEKGIHNDNEPIFIAEIGWRGTIQDNLSYVLPDKPIHGRYFGLLNYLNEQLPNSIKKSYGPNGNEKYDDSIFPLFFGCVFEMLANTDRGSVSDYHVDDDTVSPVIHNNEKENEHFRLYTRYFQMGVLASIETISRNVTKHAVSSFELRRYFIKQIDEVITNPQPVLAQIFKCFHHNESFGSGRIEEMGTKMNFPYASLVKSVFNKRKRLDTVREIFETRWPHAQLKIDSSVFHLLSRSVIKGILLGKKWYEFFRVSR
jgi:FMN phosphatase YigB (HAD superfamily)